MGLFNERKRWANFRHLSKMIFMASCIVNVRKSETGVVWSSCGKLEAPRSR